MSADVSMLVLSLVFVLLLVLNCPVAVSLGVSTFAAITVTVGSPFAAVQMIAQRMVSGIGSFALLAIPFFILSGLFMGRGGIARRMIDFADRLVGRLPGGLGHVNILTCMLFGSVSGSSAAAVSSVGGFMIPEMNRKGYRPEYNVAVTTTAAITGLLIPPSNAMIVFALASGGISIAAMFVAGLVPGILFGALLMGVNTVQCRLHGYGAERTARDDRPLWPAILRALPSLLLVVIVLGGILGGIFTPTEAAAVAVLYAFVLAVLIYREVKWSEIPGMLLQCGVATSVVMLLIGTSSAMSWILAYEDVPGRVSAALLGLTSNPLIILLIMNVLLLLVGTFMDMTPAILIFTPIFLPVAVEMGMDPVHFGVMMVANLCIGLCTPPVGTSLFVGCGVGHTTLAEVIRPLLPFFAAMIAALLLTAYIPQISLWLPTLFGLR
ncbi:TRAP transporter large permease [Kiritimatiella glycovorans]|uniref:TRAP transporter, DctM subunit subfamily n=1 Tax=Kiritimatiella glycovorans TaxID=1307763 RepID=A0A0G3EIY8_9BACT|nr:TRAP transporter large permease [Kiritimatiella glycovorans]AKJ64139.1 TRAP transporter, DctM subunit subfamily [Kiritimatiella glycovorans]